MSQEERKLLQLMDERVLNASPEELAKLQQADIRTQLDVVWFMIYVMFQLKSHKSKILQPTNSFQNNTVILNLNEGFSDLFTWLLNLKNQP